MEEVGSEKGVTLGFMVRLKNGLESGGLRAL